MNETQNIQDEINQKDDFLNKIRTGIAQLQNLPHSDQDKLQKLIVAEEQTVEAIRMLQNKKLQVDPVDIIDAVTENGTSVELTNVSSEISTIVKNTREIPAAEPFQVIYDGKIQSSNHLPSDIDLQKLTIIPTCPTHLRSSSWLPDFKPNDNGTGKIQFYKENPPLQPLRIAPGGTINFPSKKEGSRLRYFHSFLNNEDQIEAFIELRDQFEILSMEYKLLDGRDPDAYKKAENLRQQLKLFTQAENITEVCDLSSFNLGQKKDRFLQKMAQVFNTQKYLEQIDEGEIGRIPELPKGFVIYPYLLKMLQELVQKTNLQLQVEQSLLLSSVKNNQALDYSKLSPSGGTIVVGAPGVGKNWLTTLYAHLTNRSLFRTIGSPFTEPQDLAYRQLIIDGEIIFDPTPFVRALNTSYACLLYDEINMLKPETAKPALNPLLDVDRKFITENGEQNASTGLVFIGLCNDPTAAGVNDIPETLRNRCNLMVMGYPPLLDEKGVFHSDEALIYYKKITPLKQFDKDQFQAVWDQVCNPQINISESLRISDPVILRIVQDMKRMLGIADKVRKIVQATSRREGSDRMYEDISLRTMEQIIWFYNTHQLWSKNILDMDGLDASAYAVSQVYMPNTYLYKRGYLDAKVLDRVLNEAIK